MVIKFELVLQMNYTITSCFNLFHCYDCYSGEAKEDSIMPMARSLANR